MQDSFKLGRAAVNDEYALAMGALVSRETSTDNIMDTYSVAASDR